MIDRAAAVWRRATRVALLEARAQQTPDEHRLKSEAVLAKLRAWLPSLESGTLAGYWPMRGEVDPRPFLEWARALGWKIALPAIAAERQPLAFRLWRADQPLEPGPFGTSQPPPGHAVRPTALLIPLLGFDDANYRLGYGGGYYDRTLAGLDPKPLTVGVGFALGRLATIHPQPHDIPLDFIVTETRAAFE